ncbi:unnamed protein product [Arctogadus glacialis]
MYNSFDSPLSAWVCVCVCVGGGGDDDYKDDGRMILEAALLLRHSGLAWLVFMVSSDLHLIFAIEYGWFLNYRLYSFSRLYTLKQLSYEHNSENLKLMYQLQDSRLLNSKHNSTVFTFLLN